MKVAILESIVMPAGHEVEFDRILVDELNNQGHKPIFFVPQKFPFKLKYNAEVEYLSGGEAISYAGVGKFKKILLSIQREMRRRAWFNSACKKAAEGLCEAIIVPTASYRFLSSILKTDLTKSSVPVLLLLHGIMPKDRTKFVERVKACAPYKNIHIAALGMQTEFPELKDCQNFHTVLPPIYKPMDLGVTPEFKYHSPLRLGFFGQYRREKNVEFFLKTFVKAKFDIDVELLVQGATVTQEDAEDFERIQEKYSYAKNISFLHKSLLGADWQKALMDTDIMLMPYGAERYQYQPSAMLFTAIGYYKPLLQSPEMSPEVLAEFPVGETVKLASIEEFTHQLEVFVNEFPFNAEKYKSALKGANDKYSHENLIKNIVGILRG